MITRLAKSPTGIRGLDEITEGGLPAGRCTLVCGGPGCGKTLLAAEFLVHGATQFDEPGVALLFEETAADLAANVASLGFDLPELVAKNRVHVDYVRVERREIEETGDYDLEGLFVRLGHAIDRIGAKRVVLDTIEALFSAFDNAAILRAELRRLFSWLKERGVTAVITGERGEGALTRNGLEEYVSDCVILLDHRVSNQVSTRRLRIVKYRGSTHGTNEYPFLIDAGGFTVLPITSVGLSHPVSDERISTGIPGLDDMLGGAGYFRGSSVLVSGTAGTGKTSTAAHFVDAACRRGERAAYYSFEESPAQIVRNMRSIGIGLQSHIDAGLLRFRSARATLFGLEAHLARVLHETREFQPDVVVLDPMSALLGNGVSSEVRALAMRLVDSLKEAGITALLTNLTNADAAVGVEKTDVGVSSLVDTWILLRDQEVNGERNRTAYVLKSRGMRHSNQVREFLLTDHGVQLVNAYLGPEGVLTGTSRLQQQARQNALEQERVNELARRRRRYEQKRSALEAQMSALAAELDAERLELESAVSAETSRTERAVDFEREVARSRHSVRPADAARRADGAAPSPRRPTIEEADR